MGGWDTEVGRDCDLEEEKDSDHQGTAGQPPTNHSTPSTGRETTAEKIVMPVLVILVCVFLVFFAKNAKAKEWIS